MGILWQDIRYGVRMLAKTPGFTAIALVTLALGIGATTAIVSVVKIAVFEPLPVSHPERLLQLGHVDKERGWSQGIHLSALRALRQQTDLFAQVAAYRWDVLTLPDEGFHRSVPGMCVTPEFFRLWEVRPLLGRTFSPEEGQPGRDGVLVLSYRLWQREFRGDPTIIGRTVFFREGPLTVLGVMPPDFSFPDANYRYWCPVADPGLATGPYGPVLQHGPNLRVLAQTQPGVAPAQVQAFLEVLTQQQRREQESVWRSVSLQARDLREMFRTPEEGRLFGLLLGAIVFVLLIVAANIASLQSARAETRRQELATRAALGAGRVRVFRQLLTENLLLAGFGGAAALVVSVFGLDLLQTLVPADLPRLKPVTLNWDILAIAAGVTLLTGLLFGLAPAWRGWCLSLTDALKPGAAPGTHGRGGARLSQALIAGQFALVLVLSTGAGLMVRSMAGLLRVHPDLDPKHVVRVYPALSDLRKRHYSPDLASDTSAEAVLGFLAEGRQRVAALPAVTAAGVEVHGKETEVSVRPGGPSTVLKKCWVGVKEDNPLAVLRVALEQGRWLEEGDAEKGGRSVLVNAAAARQLWPGDTAVGKFFWARQRNREVAYEVVGVVGDTLNPGRDVTPQPTFYRGLQKEFAADMGGPCLIFRTTGDPVTLYRSVDRVLKTAGADLEMASFYSLHEQLWNAMVGRRTLLLYLGIFAGVGLFLAALGLYGVLTHSVTCRTREIGIRMALGARAGDVMRSILYRGLVLAVWGGILGTIIVLPAGRVLRAYLFGISPADPVTFIAVALVLAGVAFFASWRPARRAVRIDPMAALRCE